MERRSFIGAIGAFLVSPLAIFKTKSDVAEVADPIYFGHKDCEKVMISSNEPLVMKIHYHDGDTWHECAATCSGSWQLPPGVETTVVRATIKGSH